MGGETLNHQYFLTFGQREHTIVVNLNVTKESENEEREGTHY